MIPYLFRPVTDNDIDVLGRDKLQSILDHAFQNAPVSEGLKNQGTAIGRDGILPARKDHCSPAGALRRDGRDADLCRTLLRHAPGLTRKQDASLILAVVQLWDKYPDRR